jgi:hypothetical protein
MIHYVKKKIAKPRFYKAGKKGIALTPSDKQNTINFWISHIHVYFLKHVKLTVKMFWPFSFVFRFIHSRNDLNQLTWFTRKVKT